MQAFLLAFIPLFVAIDPVGAIPLFMAMTDGFTPPEKRRLAIQAVATALIVGLIFGAAGHYVFTFIGISSSDFKIAGGILLLIFSVREIFGESVKYTPGDHKEQMTGIVPLGIPLIAGPAMITTLLILHDLYPLWITALALAANLLVTLGFFLSADRISARLGPVFGKVVAKVMAIFMAAIGVMMIRKGIEALLTAIV